MPRFLLRSFCLQCRHHACHYEHHECQYRSQLLPECLLEHSEMPSMCMGFIGGSKAGAPSPGIQILSFSYSFRQKNLKIIALLGVGGPPRENPASATGFDSTYEMNGIFSKGIEWLIGLCCQTLEVGWEVTCGVLSMKTSGSQEQGGGILVHC